MTTPGSLGPCQVCGADVWDVETHEHRATGRTDLDEALRVADPYRSGGVECGCSDCAWKRRLSDFVVQLVEEVRQSRSRVDELRVQLAAELAHWHSERERSPAPNEYRDTHIQCIESVLGGWGIERAETYLARLQRVGDGNG